MKQPFEGTHAYTTIHIIALMYEIVIFKRILKHLYRA